MAYVQTEQSVWLAPAPDIRLGEVERQVILRARRDAQARRPGARLGDPRLEALRLYAMLGRYRRDAVRPLLAAGFSPAERHVIDAMLNALPLRGDTASAGRGRLVFALLILMPVLAALAAYGWARLHLLDPPIAAVLAGLALLLLTPLACLFAPRRRPGPYPRK